MDKKKIESLILEEEWEKAWEGIDIYEKNFPLDSEIDTYKFLCMINWGKLENALFYALSAVKKQPYVADVHYNCGYAYQVCGRIFEAYEQYAIAKELVKGGNPGHFEIDELSTIMQTLLEELLSQAEKGFLDGHIQDKHWVDYIAIQNKLQWGIRKPVFHDGTPIIAEEYMDYPSLPKLFLGIAGLQSVFRLNCGVLKTNTVNEETEMQRVSEEANIIKINAQQECFLPIIMRTRGELLFQTEQERVNVSYTSPLQFVNYRIPQGETIVSSPEDMFRVGEVIPITHSKKRKRLVLNIFIDGLSQTVLDDNMEMLMPFTYRFFKKGMICTNAHTAGDWTFPSIASTLTGQTMVKHKMLHSKLLRKIDINTPILYEYFNNAGYNTSKIGGNWRIAPNYGYARGMNRVRYQHMYEGFSAEKVVSEVEEQIHSMRETDQFIWMELGELHLIADEINTAPIQSEFIVGENVATKAKINSVKQEYDETKKKYYLKQIERLDRTLGGLYQYIEEQYKDDEILISLFADHGQGFLVQPEEEFLSDARTKIAFMIRGNGIEGTTDELISACDYTPIMCKLAGIKYDYTNTDANLPEIFGGLHQREFTVTESIHVGDPYQILLNGKDFKFYLKGRENVTSECRVPLEKYDVQLLDKKGNCIQNDERVAYCTKWCLEHVGSCRVFEK